MSESTDAGRYGRIEKALRLSQEKYCGESIIIRKLGPIAYRILLNGDISISKQQTTNELNKHGLQNYASQENKP